MNRTFESFALAMAAAAASAATPLFDFESEAELGAAPRLRGKYYASGVTNLCATSGSNSYFLSADSWKPGDYEWPAFTLVPAITDMRGYDRLVVDVINLGADGDVIGLNMAGPDGKTDFGLCRHLALPAWDHVRWVVDLQYWPKEADPANITRVFFYTYRPQDVHAFFDRFVLLKPGEPLPPLPKKLDSRTVAAVRAGRKAHRAAVAARRRAFLDSLSAANAAAGARPDGFLVGRASSMEGVRPKDTFAAREPKFSLRLARNEREALQVLVTPTAGDLKNVRVGVSPLKQRGGRRLPADAVKVSAVGYVKTEQRPRYRVGYNAPTNAAPGYVRLTKRTPLGWWPDPLLDFVGSCDVKDGDVQSFWVGVHAPSDAAPGTYEGTIHVSADGRRAASFPFSVRVDGFAIPKAPPMPIAVSFSPTVYVRPDQHGARDREFLEKARKKPDSPINLWKSRKLEWGDFLADHFVTMMPIYQHGGELPYDVWERLKAQGRMGCYNLCYFSSQELDKPGLEKWTRWSDWAASVLEKRLEEARTHGLEENCIFYCCDEAGKERFGEIDAMLAKFKSRFPGLTVATTAYDDSFGMGEHLRDVDIFIPQTIKFDPAKAAESRAAGHKVWWYYACDQKAPHANSFTECQPIELRLLMGAMAARWRPDGFLYYQMAYFNSLDCITSGPYTAWSPRSWWNEHGDATWVAVGPGGAPLSTQRFENFRDGLEDLWYAKLLERRLADVEGGRLKVESPSEWKRRARELLAVPRSVVDSLTNYTDDPDALYAWRGAIADLL
ncbi:MAG: DUF4091 domain-containing protein [Kiritimatiellae bacterium]|nr:DUF4091 domain-containing protein [Kiritimatiellia bacterium]